MTKLSVNKQLIQAKSFVKKGKIEEAIILYQMVLDAFPNNKRAQQGLASLNKPQATFGNKNPPQDIINQLIKF